MLKFVVLNHNVLYIFLDIVPCFLDDNWAEGVRPCCLEWVKRVDSLEEAIRVVDCFQEVVGRF